MLCGACDLLRKIGRYHHHHRHKKDVHGVIGGGSLGGGDEGFELFDSRRQLYDADERALFRSLLMTLDSYTCQVGDSLYTLLA